MNPIFDKLMNCYKSVRSKTDFVPKVALVLGSGLGDYADSIKIVTEIAYSDIEGFPVSTVPGHAGKFIFVSDVVLPTRLMKLLGAEILFLTNASGGMNKNFKAGDLMLITDHIGIFAPNPLMGPNIDELGTRFPDMSNVYDLDLQDIIRNTAKSDNIDIQEGVYVQLTGPSYESPAEIKMLSGFADAVGMSTVVEAVAANHAGMKICGISCVCNLAAGLNPTPLSHKEVQEAADAAAPKFKKLVTDSILCMVQQTK